MPVTILNTQSTLTDRYQTTIPESVRRALKLNKRDKINFSIRPDGEVVLSRVQPESEELNDPVCEAFLAFLEKDMATHPEHLMPLTQLQVQNAVNLTRDIEIDLNAPLPEED